MPKSKSSTTRRTRKRSVVPPSRRPPARAAPRPSCPVVGMGASAGGLEAFKRFFQSMPADSGIAFVIVSHLDPRHESVLAEILSKLTAMPVQEVEKRTEIRPDHVYVMRPNAALALERGVLVTKRSSAEIPRLPIDSFFRSLAEHQGENAICIVLSGTGSDGTLGLTAVKERGGFTLAETPASAGYGGMPRSAIDTGLVDRVLPVEEMPAMLIEYVRHLDRLAARNGSEGALEDTERSLKPVLRLLRQHTGHDFGPYKKSTLIRRIQRRMQIAQSAAIEDYIELLRREKKELDLLFKDLLIGVTQFFRDTEAFKQLAREVIPKLFAKRGSADVVRVWVSACATGEEAYSIGILFSEHAARLRNPPRIQIFASDVDEHALDVARQARYPEGIAALIAPARLERFFGKEGHQYKVKKAVRDLVVFSRHDVTKDPPFSRIDLISCRNLFIYLEGDLQRRLSGLFHYALRPSGFLFLGSSENVVGAPGLFRTVDRKHRLFQRKPVLLSTPAFPLTDFGTSAARTSGEETPRVRTKEEAFGATLMRILVEEFAPASVVVDERGEVVFFSGRTGKYLEPATGAPSASVLSMARRGLRPELRSALQQAVKDKRSVVRAGVTLQASGGAQRIDLVVRPLHEMGADAGLYLVVFRDAARGSKAGQRLRSGQPLERRLADQLENELESAKEHLQTTIEELESANGELKTSNEELLSMNEELQSSNEEFQTSKEELQSLNEEMETVNSELASKVEELDTVNDDLQNLLQSTRIATLFLDRELRITRFTAEATEVFRLIDTDVGRSIRDITARFVDGELESAVRDVLRTLAPCERKVRLADQEGWFLMRVSPYRSVDDAIQGVVITFFDVTELERSRAQAAQLAAIVKSSTDAILTVALDGTLVSWNTGAESLYGWSASEALGRSESLLAPPEVQKEFADITARVGRGEVVGLETVRVRKDGVRIDVSLTCSPIHASRGELALVSIIARDISDRRKAERELFGINETLRRTNEDLQHLSYAASHDLREPLRMVASYAQLLDKSAGPMLDERGRMFVGHIRNGALRMDQLLCALQEFWSVDRIELPPQRVDANQVLEGALKNLRQATDESGATVTSEALPTVMGLESPLLEVFQNLIANAVKYRREGTPPRIHVGATVRDGRCEFSVTDNGQGVPAKHREVIFQPFKRLHGAGVPGVGMGLAICARIVHRFGGRIWAESNGDGSTFKFTLPTEVPA